MNNKLLCNSKNSVNTIYLDIIISLIPLICWGVYIFGFRVLSLLMISLLINILITYIIYSFAKQKLSLSVILEPILITLMLPVTVSLWVPVIIVFITNLFKVIYRLIDYKLANPILLSYILVFVFTKGNIAYLADISEKFSPTKINIIFEQINPQFTAILNGETIEYSIFDSIIGIVPGSIGEISTILLCFSLIYLLFRKVITWHIPISMIFTVVVISYLFPTCDSIHAWEFMMLSICSGGTIFTAIYFASDYEYAPSSSGWKLFYGITCAAISIGIRYITKNDGFYFAIFICGFVYQIIQTFIIPYIIKTKQKKTT